MSDKEHWDKRFEERPLEQLGWYEDTPQPSIDLLNKTDLPKEAAILSVGAGSSKFVDYLIGNGYSNVIVNDISQTAINQLAERLGVDPEEPSEGIRLICDDLTKPVELYRMPNVDFWHDRAVLHFFNQRDEQQAYFDLLQAKVKASGYVLLGEFNKEGAEMCAGLTVCRYDLQMMKDRLGEDFMLIDSFETVFINPRGEDRPYIYALFKRHDD